MAAIPGGALESANSVRNVPDDMADSPGQIEAASISCGTGTVARNDGRTAMRS